MRTVNHAMYEDFIQRVHRLKQDPQYSQQILSCAPSHFARVFREVTGQLPQQYRKENYK